MNEGFSSKQHFVLVRMYYLKHIYNIRLHVPQCKSVAPFYDLLKLWCCHVLWCSVYGEYHEITFLFYHSKHSQPFKTDNISFLFFLSIVTKQKIYFVQTPNERELYDWLYAINPLLAGQIRWVQQILLFRDLFRTIVLHKRIKTL